MATVIEVIKSVTLVPGEKFTLPPNSELIGSTDVTSLSSNCNIPELEEIGCYVAIAGAGGDSGDGITAIFEVTNSSIIGYRLNGIEIMFSAPYPADIDGRFNLVFLKEELKSKASGIISVAHAWRGDLEGGGSGERGSLNYLLIQTIPSVANNLELLFKGSAAFGGTNSNAISRIPFIPLATADSDGYSGLPICPESVSSS